MFSTLKEYGCRPSNIFHAWADPEGGQGDWTPPPGESQVAVCFLRNASTGHSREAIGPKRAQLLLEEVRAALCELPVMTK